MRIMHTDKTREGKRRKAKTDTHSVRNTMRTMHMHCHCQKIAYCKSL